MSQSVFAYNKNTIKIAASTASTNMAFDTGINPAQVVVSNQATAWAFVVFGTSAVASTLPTTSASAPGMWVAPNAQTVITPGTLATYACVSLTSGTGSVYFTPGEGF